MALGTPTAATVAYSAASGTSVAPSYPTGLVADDIIVMFVGQKPTTANGGTVTTPTGWTLRESLTAAGGYGATLGADTGNTNLFVYTKDTVTGSETGTLSVTVGDNNVCWAFMVRVPVGNGTISYGTAEGQRTTTPTSPMSIALTNGTSATNFQAGDLALWAMVIPTDVTTPSQFSAESITATGATFGTAVEFNEPDSATGNDIGGYSAYASVSSGSSTTAPTVTTTLTGTLTNVRGPVVLLRVRETAPPSQSLTPSLYTNTNTFFGPTVDAANTLAPALYNNTNTFYSPTVGRGVVNLAPTRYSNTNTFYAAAISQTGGAQALVQSARYNNTNSFYSAAVSTTRNLAPSRYDNANSFYTATVGRGAVNLAPVRYDNTNAFYAVAVTTAKTLSPTRYDNSNSFFSPAVTQGTSLLPARYDNSNSFYTADISTTRELTPARYDNTNDFYSATVGRGSVTLAPARYDNTNDFYSPAVTQEAEGQSLLPARYDNTNSFYAATVTYLDYIRFEDYVDPGYVDSGYIGLAVENTQTWYTAQVSPRSFVRPALFSNTNTFYTPRAIQEQFLLPLLFTNVNRFPQAKVVSRVAPPRVNNTNSFFGPTVAPSNPLAPARLDNTNTFYTPVVVPPNATLAPALYANDNDFPPATVRPGAVNLAPARVNNVNAFFAASAYQFWNIRPAFLLNLNNVFPPVVMRGLPTPNWNKGTIANDDAYVGDIAVNAPNWTQGNQPPTPNFNPDTQSVVPDWNPQ